MPPNAFRPAALRSGIAAVLIGGLLAAGSVASPTQAAPTPRTVRATATGTVSSSADFVAGHAWNGEFADPSILRVGRSFYAYGTVWGGDNMPTEHTDDLDGTWYLRDAYPADANPGWWKGYNDAMPHPATWALYSIVRNGRHFTNPWAPSVAKVGPRYVAAYSVSMSAANPSRRCLSIATSSNPVGEFTDTTSQPIVCSSDPNGSNDPQIYQAPTGKTYLIWKNAGVPRKLATWFWTRQLDASATAFAPGSKAVRLLGTAQPWEGKVIEGPAMINYAGRYYLFYAGNGYADSSYAIGYAICRTAIGPCTRPTSTPLLATGGTVAGPGSPAPVVGVQGALRLGYAAWDIGHTGYGDPSNHRRLHVARLIVGPRGLLRVATRG